MTSIRIFSLALLVGLAAMADETVLHKADDAKNQTVDSVKSTTRMGEDKACKMVNGSMKCLPKKVKHEMSNAADAAGTKATEVKHKVED